MKSMIFHLRNAVKKTVSRLPDPPWTIPLVQLSGKSTALLLIALLVAVATPLLAQNNTPAADTGNASADNPVQAIAEQISAQNAGRTLITFNKGNGVATFMRLPANANLDLAAVNRDSAPTAIASAFFNQYGAVFGVRDAGTELTLRDTRVDQLGMNHLTYAQNYQGVPVFGAELKAHIAPNGSVRVVNGDFVPDINLDITPSRTVIEASEVAVRAVLAGLGLDAQNSSADVGMVKSQLYIFDTGLLRRIAGQTHLVYEIEVTNSANSIREFVYVDAHSGKVVEQISGIHESNHTQEAPTPTPEPPPPTPGPIPTVVPTVGPPATPAPVPDGMNRQMYQYFFAPSALIWAEGDPLPYEGTDEVDVNNMIEYAEDTYNLLTTLSDGTFKSWDGQDGPMHSVVLDGFDFFSCPNAYWNSVSTNFCPGVTADDTVGHEWAHAYTESTHDLIYAWQPGALNESYSDIIGEVVDLLNQSGLDEPNISRTQDGCSVFSAAPFATDESVRWLSGEDDPSFGGAIRDLWNPNCYGDPAKVSDELYWCSIQDGGGVHTNSGVPNHAFALLVDGGDYNGQSIAPIGLTKAMHLYWRAATEYQVPATNFIEHADALESSCMDLVEFGGELPGLSTDTDTPFGSGETMTEADCGELAKAIEAVELRIEPSQCEFESLLAPDAPAFCQDAGDVETISLTEWEDGLGEWTIGTRDVADELSLPPNWEIISDLPQQRAGSAAFVVNSTDYGDCNLSNASGVRYLDSPVITLPDDVYIPHISIDHFMASELGYDGGNIKVSVNDSPWSVVPAESFTFNPYNATLFGSPMSGEAAFSGADEGEVSGSWGQSQLNLFGIAEAGDEIKIRVEFGQDGCFGLEGWYVDDVHLYSCSDQFPGSACGNKQIDIAETCDDGNDQSGDGCSNLCLVEEGFVCSPPTPPQDGSNILLDGSFELGTPNPHWVEESSTFLSPLYNATSFGIPADDGDWITVFGFYQEPEFSSVEQAVTIPDTATTLDFAFWKPFCDTTSDSDQMRVLIDGLEAYATNIPCTFTSDYNDESVDISAYADNAEHTVRFEGEIGNVGGSVFVIDDVMLGDNIPVDALGSVCEVEQAKIDVDRDGISVTLRADSSGVDGFAINNPGNSTLYWDASTDSGNRAILPLRHSTGVSTLRADHALSTNMKLSAQKNSDGLASESASALMTNPARINPIAQARLNAAANAPSNALTIGTTALTHSMEQDIQPQNSAYCEIGSNSYFRLFNLADFGLSSTLSVTEVEVGIEQAVAGSDVIVNLYTLGETLVYTDMTLIASTTQLITDTQLALVSVPFGETAFAAGSTLVVEVVMPEGLEGAVAQIVGSNNLGQTAPTYMAAPGCEIPDPVDAAVAGYADMHVVINVLGNVGDDFVTCSNPATLPWLNIRPDSGSTEAGRNTFVDLAFNSLDLEKGLYQANICINSNAVNTPLLTIPLSMTVQGDELLYFSSDTWGTVDGRTFTDEDIMVYDPQSFSRISQVFDASDVGLTGNDLNAFAVLENGDLLMSFNYSRLIPDVGWVADADIVRFTPTSVGFATAGTFALYFDGSAYGLASIGEDIDAISFTPDGQLVISTLGSYRVPSAAGDLVGQDEDLLLFDEATGTWSLYWDGTSAGFDTSTEDIWGASIVASVPSVDPETKVYLTTLGKYAVEGETDPEAPLEELTGDGNDIVVCAAEASAGGCVLRQFWDGDLYGLTGLSIDAFAIADRLPDYSVDPEPDPLLQSAQIDDVDAEVDTGDLEDDVVDGTDDQIEESPLDNDIYVPFMMTTP